jgi:acylphosphatase
MMKCIKVTCMLKVTKVFADFVQKHAHKLALEGFLQIVTPDQIKIVVCGAKDNIDKFVDILYKEGAHKKPFSLEVEPFLKDKDYRGVFRIIA